MLLQKVVSSSVFLVHGFVTPSACGVVIWPVSQLKRSLK
nr:MAG TPA: hypothetical protein [Caudoviricetes sp.]